MYRRGLGSDSACNSVPEGIYRCQAKRQNMMVRHKNDISGNSFIQTTSAFGLLRDYLLDNCNSRWSNAGVKTFILIGSYGFLLFKCLANA